MRSLFLLGLLPLLNSCGSVSEEARVANFLQTIMANAVEAYLLRNGPVARLECSQGGELAYVDPGELSEGITTASNDVTFNDCSIDACDQKITFEDQGETKLTLMGLTEEQIVDIVMGGNGFSDGDQFIELQISAVDQKISGFLKGNISFAYRMRIVGSAEGLKGVMILDSTLGDPLKINGRTYKAEELSKLADGC